MNLSFNKVSPKVISVYERVKFAIVNKPISDYAVVMLVVIVSVFIELLKTYSAFFP